jgi:hypothetical protein
MHLDYQLGPFRGDVTIGSRTVCAASDDAVERTDEVGEDCVYIVEPCEDNDDIGARMGVLLG